MTRFLRLTVPLALLVGVLGIGGPAYAGPANDNIAGAITIPVEGLPYVPAAYSTAGAGTESGEPSPTCALSGAGASVWYKWSDTTPADLTISTAGSTNGSDQLDTVVAAFHQTGSQYVLDTCNDDSSGSDNSQQGLRTSVISFQAAANTTYYIQVTGSRGRDGVTPETGTLRFSVSRRPLNDDMRNAINATPLPFADVRNVSGATEEPSEPAPTCQGAFAKSTVWYRYTATQASIAPSPIQADTFGSTYDTILSAYNQTPSGLSPLTCSDDDSGTSQSRIELTVTPGTYWFQVSSKSATGILTFHLGPQPLNDRFGSAEVISAIPSTVSQSTAGAGREDTEKQPPCMPAGNTYGASVWYTLTVDPAALEGPVTIDTIGSSYPTILAVWTGSSLASLVSQGCSIGPNAKVTLPTPPQSTTYAIQIASTGVIGSSASFAGGNLVLNVPPFNNDLSAAKEINPAALPFTDARANVGSTALGEPTPSCVAANTSNTSVWYKLTAPAGPTVTYTVFTDGSFVGTSRMDTVVSVFTGLPATEVGGSCNDDFGVVAPQSRSQFAATPGATYYIRVSGKANAVGSLFVKVLAQPQCDSFVTPCQVAAKPFSVSRTMDEIASATTEAGEPNAPCITGAIKNSIWYSYKPATSGVIYADTIGSRLNTVLMAYNSTTPSSTSRIACSDDAQDTQSRIEFNAVANTTYLFQIASFGDNAELVVFNITPDNNNIANATSLPSIPFSTGSVSTIGATTEIDEPAPASGPLKRGCTSGPSATIWYKVTVAAPATLTVDTVGSDYDTVLGLFTPSGATATPVDCNDDVSATVKTSRLTFDATPGATYLLQLGGNPDKLDANDNTVPQTGTARVNLIAAPPANDTAEQAARIGTPSTVLPSGVKLSDTRGTYGATFAGEPAPGCTGTPGGTIWYAYTALGKLKVDIDTAGSNYKTFIAVYAVPTPLGGPPAIAPPLACNADTTVAGQAHVGFTTVPGITYFVQVGGVSGATGKATVNILSRPSL